MKRWAIAAMLLCATSANAAGRRLIFISDLHFGEGRIDGGQRWDPYEDFRWHDDFAKFLAELQKSSPASIELVINGDAFELWQSRDDRCKPAGHEDAGCTEAEAIDRMKHVLGQHAEDLKLLRDFAAAKDNRVVFVPGNHDALLLFGGVSKALLDALGNPPRISVAKAGHFRSEDGAVHAEHGHMIGSDPNKLEGWPAPFVDVAGEQRMRRPWGEQFVIKFYDQWEDKYQIIDNISEELYGAKLAMALEGKLKSMKALGGLTHFFFLDTSRAQLAGVLGDSGGPGNTLGDAATFAWDVPKLKKKGPAGLAATLPDGDPLKGPLARGEWLTQADVDAMPEADLKDICDAAFARALKASNGHPDDAPCPYTGTLGAIREGIVSSRETIFSKHLDGLQAGALKVFVYSHTHKAHKPFRARASGANNPAILNSGAFQRTVTPAQLKKLSADPKAQLLLALERLPACYPFIQVSETPARDASLRSFRKGAAGWAISDEACDSASIEPAP